MQDLEERLSHRPEPCKKEWLPIWGPLQAIADRIMHRPSYLGPGNVDESTIGWNIYHTFATGFPISSYLYFLLN